MHESGEMYLETIYVLYQKNRDVRSIDVAEEMGFSKPSVSRGVSILKRDGYLTVDEKGYLELTDSGMDLAMKIYERHTILTKTLVLLGVDEQTAAQDACKMEHVISDKTLEAFKKHLNEHIKQ
ncbi:metal-dependent transcriptional regulator [uncultured Eubacterium sp.]|uniref:metal-dependent transcriptional regulator n=1 Tax=uncultured Eubacterium sp. TaxID=165185 RepID=UPI00262B2C83|nr:metal-dependent transcriptional regulator [uncultured Eubacterium sp.]